MNLSIKPDHRSGDLIRNDKKQQANMCMYTLVSPRNDFLNMQVMFGQYEHMQMSRSTYLIRPERTRKDFFVVGMQYCKAYHYRGSSRRICSFPEWTWQ